MAARCIIVLWLCTGLCAASNGDRSYVFQRCLQACRMHECHLPMPTSANPPPPASLYKPRNLSLLESLITWDCNHECRYHCMWWAVDAFREDNLDVPQFNGRVRWPAPCPHLHQTLINTSYYCYIPSSGHKSVYSVSRSRPLPYFQYLISASNW